MNRLQPFWPRQARWLEDGQRLRLTDPWSGPVPHLLLGLIGLCFDGLGILALSGRLHTETPMPGFILAGLLGMGSLGLVVAVNGLRQPPRWLEIDFRGRQLLIGPGIEGGPRFGPAALPVIEWVNLHLWLEKAPPDEIDEWSLTLETRHGRKVPLFTSPDPQRVRQLAQCIQRHVGALPLVERETPVTAGDSLSP